jgi:hypothetical protein
VGDKAPQEIRERVWVEKFDHSGDTPVLVETTFVERTRRGDEVNVTTVRHAGPPGRQTVHVEETVTKDTP